MSTEPEPRAIGLVVVAPSSGRGGPSPTDTEDDEALLRLTVWLAEVSAEATLRRPAWEAKPPAAEPTS